MNFGHKEGRLQQDRPSNISINPEWSKPKVLVFALAKEKRKCRADLRSKIDASTSRNGTATLVLSSSCQEAIEVERLQKDPREEQVIIR